MKKTPSIAESRAVEAAARVRATVDPSLQRTVADRATTAAIQGYFKERFLALDVGRTDTLEPRHNRWNVTNKKGLQSVGIDLIRGGKPVFMPSEPADEYEEWRSPTIIVTRRGLIGKGPQIKAALDQFQLDPGHREKIRAMGPNPEFFMDGSQNIEPVPALLSPDKDLIVVGPDAVRVIIELENPAPEDVRKVVTTGVARCIFERLKK